jgi:ABC-type uncharacterized transport system involved in gliding motility auxiliary subunit
LSEESSTEIHPSPPHPGPRPRFSTANLLDQLRGPLVVLSGLCFLTFGGAWLVAGEFGVVARFALAGAVFCLGMYVAIDPGKAWGAITSRESIHGSNAVVLSVAFVVILVVANVLSNRFHQRWDVTAQRDFSLSDATLKLLAELPQEVTARAFFSTEIRDRQKADDLLKEYAARSNGRLKWELIDTNLDPVVTKLAGINVDGTIRFQMGDRTQDSITTEESYVTTALIKLVNPDPLKIYYMVGHGEREIEKFDEDGYSELKTQIQRDNFVLDTLNLLATGRVPDDAKALIIAAPKTPFQELELEAIKRYMDGKGRLVLLVDPFQTESNAEEIIKRWDLTIGKGVVIDPVSSLQQSPLSIIVLRYGLHDIVKNLGGLPTLMPFSTTVEIPEFIKRGVDVSGLALTADTRSWLETDRTRPEFTEGQDKKGPLTLAVAVEEAESPPAEDPPPGFRDPNKRVKNRAVIIGNSEMVINGLVKQPLANRDFFLNSLNWVTQTDQLITTRPYIAERRTVFLNQTETNFLFYSSAVFLPILLLGIGTVMWWTRR